MKLANMQALDKDLNIFVFTTVETGDE